jgi:hypothetical protein
MASNANTISSAGHKLGQLIGDWFEVNFVLPLLTEVATRLRLFLDNRQVARPMRSGDKIIWPDEEGNSVDYDFVLELGGTEDQIGMPVAFVECFWRRGARHSKDKARDDSGKLAPMRATYPTARFLGIVAAGDFTEPARDLVRSHDIDLFYVPKDKIVEAFARHGLVMDYPDSASEQAKARLASSFEQDFTSEKRLAVAATLVALVGQAAVTSYVDRVRAKLSALPQEIRLILRHESSPLVFNSMDGVTAFLRAPTWQMSDPRAAYLYQATFSDGSEFERTLNSVDALRELHRQMEALAAHVSALAKTAN